MRRPNLPVLQWPVLLWLAGAGLFVGLLVERANTPILTREAFVSLLAQCGASGQPIPDSVRALGLSERAWGRTVSTYAANPEVARELEQRLALAVR